MYSKEDIDLIKEKIKSANKVVFFGGAGVSTASGLKDFRSKDGLYSLKSKYDKSYEEMLSIDYFYLHTETFYKFYKEFFLNNDAKPNKAHYALSEFEKLTNKLTIITQNIDSLHQEAGSKNVIELHGACTRNYCVKCHKKFEVDFIKKSKGIPFCTCGGIIRPDIVFYQEPLDYDVLYNAIKAIEEADVIIIGGTSLKVYPAGGLIKNLDKKLSIIINKDETDFDNQVDYVFKEDIGEILSKILDI